MLELLRLLLLLMLMLKLLLMLELLLVEVENWCIDCRCLLEDGRCKCVMTPVDSRESFWGKLGQEDVVVWGIGSEVCLLHELRLL